MLLSFDLAGAEWFVVAYLAMDETMIAVHRSGASPHPITGSRMFGVPIELILREHAFVKEATGQERVAELRRRIPELGKYKSIPRTMSIRQAGKKAGHGLNYGEGYRMFALMNEIEESEGKRFVEAYHRAWPGVRDTFQANIQRQLKRNRTLTNCFGRKCYLMEAMGEELFKQGYAFIPQSTVGDIVNQGLIRCMNDDALYMRDLEQLSQVHDSGIFQYPPNDWLSMALACQRIVRHLSPQCEYNGRQFTLGVDAKVGLNRAHMREVAISADERETAFALQAAYEALRQRRAA